MNYVTVIEHKFCEFFMSEKIKKFIKKNFKIEKIAL